MPHLVGIILVASAALAGGCSPGHDVRDPEWERAVLEARRLHDDGKLDRAERRYRTLLERAADDEDRRWAMLQLARVSRDRGNLKNALRRYRDLWETHDTGSTAGRAMFEMSTLVADRLDEPKRARQLRRRIVQRYPGTSWAGRSLEALALYYREHEDWSGLVADFESLYQKVRDTEAGEDVLFTLAHTLDRWADRPRRAAPYYRKVFRRYSDTDMADDARWELAQILVGRQRWPEALRHLRRLADMVKPSPHLGTISSPYASRARYLLGFLHLTHLDNPERAIEHFDIYLEEFSRKTRSDQAAWHRAQAFRLLGRTDAYHDALRSVIEKFPKSRYAERARRELPSSSS